MRAGAIALAVAFRASTALLTFRNTLPPARRTDRGKWWEVVANLHEHTFAVKLRRPSGDLRAEEDDEAADRVAVDGEEVADEDVPPAPEQVDLDGDAVPVDDERSGRWSHVGALEQAVAVEAADRLTPVVGAGVGDELG